ncbi:MAG: hypothetical protein JWP94_1474 [Mucilaginibacter sp.]|jgi:hypothetical protein|nr:hypothetical protein [Mucilaginibacter sp.]
MTLLFGWTVWRIRSGGPLVKGRASTIIIFLASFPSLINEAFHDIGANPLINRDHYPLINGFKMAGRYVDSNYLLLPAYDKKEGQSIIKLMRIYDQKTIYQWKPNVDELKKLPNVENQFGIDFGRKGIFFIHPLLSSDGSVVFHQGNLLVKIDKNSNIIWAVDESFHHSLEYDADGNIWSPSVISPTKTSPAFLNEIQNDAITKISPGGKVLFQKSIAVLLVENGYKGLILGAGLYEKDLIHLNDIQPALTSGRYWQKGDLLMSIRNKSTVCIYRPSTNKIVWLKTGPWLNQHDVDFIDSTRIGIFGNDLVRTEQGYHLLDEHNEEYVYDLKTDKTTTPYTAFLKKAKVSTYFEGRSDILSNGDLFVEESNNNRLLRGTKTNILWQYVDRIDQHSSAVITWSRFITKEELKKLAFLQNKRIARR